MLVSISSRSVAGLFVVQRNLIKSGRASLVITMKGRAVNRSYAMGHKLGLGLHVGTHGVSTDYA